MGAAPVLDIVLNGETVKSISVEGEMLLGRGEGCVIRLNDRAVSRQHALLKASQGGIQIERKSEFAPLSLNGTECTQALLKDGDVVAIGPYLLRMQQNKVSKSVAPMVAVPVVAAAPVEATQMVDMSDIPLDSPATSDLNLDSPILDQASEALMPPPELELPQISEMISKYSPPEAVAAPVDENASTRVLDSQQLEVKLIFPPGSANHTEYVVKKDEISIGRAKECDVVLADKKASRKNTVIRRKNATFVISDLESANGTYVNGEKIGERDLVSGDLVRIGNVEFKFMAMSADYAALEQKLAVEPVVQQSEPSYGSELPVAEAISHTRSNISKPISTDEKLQIPGMGLPGVGTGKRATLVERFKAQPKFRQVLILLILGLGAWWIMEDDAPTPVVTQKPVGRASGSPAVSPANSAASSKLPPGYETLTPEQQKFIAAQRNLGFDYYKNKEYDRALFELNKIFSLVPDFQDAREIERYAKEGKRKLEAMEEERKRKEAEEKLKARVGELVEEARLRMNEKNYTQAVELFGEILALDPDNATVADWKKTVDAWQEDQQRIVQEKQVQAQINKNGWEIYGEARELKKQGHFHRAIATATKVFDIGASDQKLVSSTRGLIHQSRDAIAAARDPLLAEAKQAETSGDLPKAYQQFEKATVIDPRHPEGHAGMNRIRSVLHDRAKNIYTEAVLAESYSDLALAKKKYLECMSVAPHDDIYYERSERKLARYPKSSPSQDAP